MVLSLTGFGRGVAEKAGLTLTVECQTVNRRQFEVQVSGSKEAIWVDAYLAELARPVLERGRVQFVIRKQVGPASATLAEHEVLQLRGILARVREAGLLMEVCGLEQEPAAILWALQRVEGERPTPEAEEESEFKSLLTEAAGLAMQGVIRMRQEEGKRLGADLGIRIANLETKLEAIRDLSKDAATGYRQRLLERLSMTGLDLDLEDDRVLKELALFAERCDISEEITRIASHLSQFSGSLESNETEVGRKLDFLCQELHREFNTIGSKAGGAETIREVIDAKQEVEKIREQVQNVL